MKAHKVFISLLLLLTYSLGFAHNLIPHNHNTETKEQIIEHDGHHHHGHQHTSEAHTDHNHISHGNHYDEDFYDLLVCFLHNPNDHQENSCDEHHYLPNKTNRIVSNNLQKVILLAITTDIFFDKNETEYFKDYIPHTSIIHDSPHLKISPLRGPPTAL